MVLPNFLIVGAQKCGTTSLHDLLAIHPEANMSWQKEVNFFINRKKYEKGLGHYSTFWHNNTPKTRVIGEASPGYLVYPGVAEKIYQDLGAVKIVIILRDPIRRALSQYWDNRRHLSEHLSFEQAIDHYLSDDYDPTSKGYFSRGIYIKYIEVYWKFFGKQMVHIMTLENLIADPRSALKGLYDFLGISTEPEYLVLNKSSNSSRIWENGPYKFLLKYPQYTKYLPVKMRRIFFFGSQRKYRYEIPADETLNRLKDFYGPWNQRLSEATSLDINSWT